MDWEYLADRLFDAIREFDGGTSIRLTGSDLLDVVRRHWRRNTEHAEAAVAAD